MTPDWAISIIRTTLSRGRQLLGSPEIDEEKAFFALGSAVLQGRMELLRRRLLQRIPPVVQSGPFQGMKLHPSSMEGSYIPLLLGCYEQELHPFLREVQRTGYERIINLGAADGYYAVGLARLCPTATVYAYEINEKPRAACASLAQMNQVANRILIRGRFHAEEWEAVLEPGARTLIVCDVEGAEYELLNPELHPLLRRCDVLVELHHAILRRPELTPQLLARFEESHSVEVIESKGRDPGEIPFLRPMSQFEQFLCTHEGRPAPTPWGIFRARAEAPGA